MALPQVVPYPPIKTQFFTKAGNIAEEWQRFFLQIRTGLNFVITSGTAETGIQTLGAVGLEAIGQPLPDDFILPGPPSLPSSVVSSALALLTDSETPEEMWPLALPGSLFIGEPIIAGTVGSVLFIGSAGLAQDNAKLFWKDSQPALGINTPTPTSNIGLNVFVDITDSAGVGGGSAYHGSGPQEGATFCTGSGFYFDAVGATTASQNNKIYFRTTDVNASYTGKIRWAIDHDGSLNAGNTGAGGDDNKYDIGLDFTHGRPRTVRVGTSIFTPLLEGGNAVGSTLTLQSTSGVGTSDAILFLVGNNGGTEGFRVDTNGRLGIGVTSPSQKIHTNGIIELDDSGSAPTVTSTHSLMFAFNVFGAGETFVIRSADFLLTRYDGGVNYLIIAANSGNFSMSGLVAKYNAITTAGWGVPAIYGLDNRTGLTGADGAAITLYTTVAANNIFRVSADIFATAAVTGTATYSITWTENSTGQTMSVTATAINTLGTQSNLIRPDNGTAIKAQLTGVFTGTFTVVGLVEQVA